MSKVINNKELLEMMKACLIQGLIVCSGLGYGFVCPVI